MQEAITMPMKSIPEILKSSRKAKGFSTAAVCEFLKGTEGIDISPSTLYGYENGHRSPTPEIFLALCDFYEIDNVFAAFGYSSKADYESSQSKAAPLKRVSDALDVLNDKGQAVAVERVEELTKIPDYQRAVTPTESTQEPTVDE